MLYQLGRNSNTHFFRYLLRHIEHDFTAKEKRAQREERRGRYHRRPISQHINGEQSDLESVDEDDDMNVSVVGSENGGTQTSSRRRHHKIAMAYNA